MPWYLGEYLSFCPQFIPTYPRSISSFPKEQYRLKSGNNLRRKAYRHSAISPTGAMADANSVGHLQGLVTCSVCLERCQDPVIRHCGHNLCQACINRPWREVTEQITCPWCKEDFGVGKSGSDNQPWKVEEIDKQFLLEEPSLWPERVCADHREELKLYCVEDQTFICLVCRDAQKHKSHTVIPRMEAEANIKQEGYCANSVIIMCVTAAPGDPS